MKRADIKDYIEERLKTMKRHNMAKETPAACVSCIFELAQLALWIKDFQLADRLMVKGGTLARYHYETPIPEEISDLF